MSCCKGIMPPPIMAIYTSVNVQYTKRLCVMVVVVSTTLQVLAWAEHYTNEQKSDATVSNQPPLLPHPPSSPTTTSSGIVNTPFQPRPQPYVPQRSSHRLHPPPGPSLTPWERDFISKNKDDVYDLLLVSVHWSMTQLAMVVSDSQ